MGPMILCVAVLAMLLTIRGVELNPGPVDNIVQVLCSGCDRNLSRELNVNRVAGGIITAVEMLSCKLRRVENGTATDVDLRDSGFGRETERRSKNIENSNKTNNDLRIRNMGAERKYNSGTASL